MVAVIFIIDSVWNLSRNEMDLCPRRYTFGSKVGEISQEKPMIDQLMAITA